ncbi:hypothetical protein EDD85DRAFT_794680 [Armillaria nabsnona]|nr:hypothetical protein EDD85DRAFT_794680 [Armillaria nabsnona]
MTITSRYQTMDAGSVPSSDPAESEYEYQMSKEPQSNPMEVDDSDSEEELETVREISIMVQDDANRFGNVDVSLDATMGLNNDAFMDSDFEDYSMPSTPSRRDIDVDDHLQGLFGVLQGNHPPRTVQTPPLRLEPSLVVPPVPARLLTDQGTLMGASTDVYEPPPVEPDWSCTPPPDNQVFLHEEEHMDDERLGDHESPPDGRDQTFYIEYNLFMSHQFIDGQVGVHVERNMILPVLDPFNPRISFKSLLHACKDRADPTGRLVDHLLTLDRPYYVATNTTPMTLTCIQGDFSTQMTHREIGRLDHVLDTAVGEEWTGPCISCEEKDVIDAGTSWRLPYFVVYLVPSLWNVSSPSHTAALPVTSEDVQVEEGVQPNDTESRRPTTVTRPLTTPDALTEPAQWVEWDLAYSGMIDLLAELDCQPWNMAFKRFTVVQATIAISKSVGVLRISRGFNQSLKPVQEWMLVRLRSKGITLMAIEIGTFQNWVSSLRTDLEAIFQDLTERKVWYTFPWPDAIEGSYKPTTEDIVEETVAEDVPLGVAYFGIRKHAERGRCTEGKTRGLTRREGDAAAEETLQRRDAAGGGGGDRAWKIDHPARLPHYIGASSHLVLHLDTSTYGRERRDAGQSNLKPNHRVLHRQIWRDCRQDTYVYPTAVLAVQFGTLCSYSREIHEVLPGIFMQLVNISILQFDPNEHEVYGYLGTTRKEAGNLPVEASRHACFKSACGICLDLEVVQMGTAVKIEWPYPFTRAPWGAHESVVTVAQSVPILIPRLGKTTHEQRSRNVGRKVKLEQVAARLNERSLPWSSSERKEGSTGRITESMSMWRSPSNSTSVTNMQMRDNSVSGGRLIEVKQKCQRETWMSLGRTCAMGARSKRSPPSAKVTLLGRGRRSGLSLRNDATRVGLRLSSLGELLLSSTTKEKWMDVIEDPDEGQVKLTGNVSDLIYQFLGQLQEHR